MSGERLPSRESELIDLVRSASKYLDRPLTCPRVMRHDDGVCATAVNTQLRRLVHLSAHDDGEILVLMADRATNTRAIHEISDMGELPALRVKEFLNGQP